MQATRRFAACISVLAIVGCASWFTDRVGLKERELYALTDEADALTARRAELEAARLEATSEEDGAAAERMMAEVDAALVERRRRIERTEEQIDRAEEGAQQEAKNRGALLMGIISVVAGGLKLATDAAGKAT